MLGRWRDADVFARSLANRADAEVWSFYEGPPTANGRPGSHHVLARVFKDIYPRYKTMCGYRVPRKAGWDCHGLPVELEVEKQLGISSKQEIEEFGIAEFNQRCRESVFEYVEEWNRLTERIGFWIDLDDPYVTLEDDYIESVWWSLKQHWDEGRLYEGHKVVPYCPRDGTPLSSHEVAQGYKDVEDPSIYVRFPLLDGDGGESGESLLVWTTTPWTLPGQRRRRRRARGHLRARRGRRRGPDPGRAAAREGAGGGGRDPRPLLRPRPRRPLATKARSSTSPTAARHGRNGAVPGGRRRVRHHRGWHRPRPHRPGLRRRRLPRSPPRTGSSTRPSGRRSTTRSSPTATSTAASPASRTASSRTRR